MVEEVVKRVAVNVRALREAAGLSLSELARRSGVSKAALSQIEAAQGNPTVETLWGLAQALDVPFGDLSAEPLAPVVTVVHPDENGWIAGDPISSRLLHRLATAGVLEIHQIRVEPGRPRRSEAHQRGLTEHVILHEGRVRIGPVEDPVVIAAGDTASFLADRPHIYEGLEPSAGLLLMHYPALPRLAPRYGSTS